MTESVFSVCILKLIVNLKLAEDKNPECLAHYATQMQLDIEDYFGAKLDRRKYVEYAISLVEDKFGYRLSQDQYDYLQDLFNHECDYCPKSIKHNYYMSDEYEADEKKFVPYEVVWGVTLALCGVYLVTIGWYVETAKALIVGGVAMAAAKLASMLNESELKKQQIRKDQRKKQRLKLKPISWAE